MVRKIAVVAGAILALLVLLIGGMLAWPLGTPEAEVPMDTSSVVLSPEGRAHTRYEARDGTALPLRVYEAGDSDTALILIHGISGHGDYLYPLASVLARSGHATVYVPDLRGHGEDPARRGDIDHIHQMEEDFADLMAWIREHQPGARIIAGGHSAGGGLALRMATSASADEIHGYLLLAPFLGPMSPTSRQGGDNNGAMAVSVPRFLALMLLNRAGVTAFNHLPVIRLSIPEAHRDGRETATYTWRAFVGYVPRDHKAVLEAVDAPLLLISGTDDEVMHAEQYLPVLAELAPGAEVMLLPGIRHMDVIIDPQTAALAAHWLMRQTAEGEQD